MPVIDIQVDPFDRNHPGRPWASPSHGLYFATGEEMVAAMNSVGVDCERRWSPLRRGLPKLTNFPSMGSTKPTRPTIFFYPTALNSSATSAANSRADPSAAKASAAAAK